jgi:sigma-E factor negative regulatory protein RseB
LPKYSADLEPHYQLVLYRPARVANRKAQVLGIKPKDEYRYGYMLWLDKDTAMPLKSQLLDESGHIVEQILFTQISLPDSIPASAVKATTDTTGFTWLRTPRGEEKIPGKALWKASRLPGGFKLSVAVQDKIAGSQYPVEHLVYTDGLAIVSVFIEDPKTKTKVARGFSRIGSTNAFSLILRGRQVTAVGEVPKQTVQTIATSLTAQ